MQVTKERTKHETIVFVMNGLEGEYDNDPRDSGGETFWGVTHVAWADFLGTPMNETVWPVPGFDKSKAYQVYDFFWDKMKIDLLPPEMRLMVFAFGFNAGYWRASKFMQTALGLKPDGIPGPVTQGAYIALKEMTARNEVQFSFVQQVKDYYIEIDKDRDNDGKGDFISGWLNRLLKTIIFI